MNLDGYVRKVLGDLTLANLSLQAERDGLAAERDALQARVKELEAALTSPEKATE